MVALSPLSPAEARATSAAGSRRKPAVLAFAKPGSSLLISLVASAGFLALWFLVARLRLVTPLFLPSPLEVAQAFVTVARDGFADATLLQHAGSSLTRVSIAFLVAFATAVPLGLAMGLNRWVKGIFDPPIELYWPIPPLAYLPLVISAQAGVRSVSLGRVQAALSLGASHRQLFFHVVLPGALPEILTGVRIAIGAGWSTLVAAELVAATRGLGFMTLSASEFLVTDVVFVGILTIAAFAIAFVLAIRSLERVLTPWKGKE